MSVFLLFVSFGIVYLVQFFVKKILLWSKLPPGPWGVPLLGSVPFLGGGPLHLKLDSLRKKHGDVFTVGVFHKEVVVLSDWESVRDFFGRLDFSGRPDALLFRQVALGNNGIVSSQGSLWQENRRFTLRVLRDFGLGKREALDSMIQDAALGLCRSLRARRHEPQDFGPHLNLAVLNVIWKMTADKQFAHDDPRMQDFMDRVLEVLNDSSLLGPIQWVPAFVYLWPPALKAYRRVNRNMAAISQIFLNEVEEHKRNLPSSGGSKDYIDAYLTEMALQKSRGEVNPNFTEFQLRVNISDLFIAGSESTATAIRWSVLFLLCHPDVQEKLQAEVDSVVGHDRLPSLHDRNRFERDGGWHPS
ncbi:unnamed protein product [Darwinula stevensoni]|uniref:Cytochrome P450 n=1 Tax=Darwinula stevensoni TaxID=69355 RepID=A0A7R9AAQ5_9CRUS|nr:unnamed protein product [Darwinula stevensoni]CAG0898256.1 unnamed protein product [Darwinula stevensoni]